MRVSNGTYKALFYNKIKNYISKLISTKALPEEEVKQALISYKLKFKSYITYESNSENFGYYLAGFLEGDGTPKNKTILHKNLLNINLNVMTKRNYNLTSYSRNFITNNNSFNRAYSIFYNTRAFRDCNNNKGKNI